MSKEGKKTLLINSGFGLQLDHGDTCPLLLAAVQGTEGISMPYGFDLTLYSRPENGDIDPRDMVNTRAAFGIRCDNATYLWRAGVIETFARTGDNNIANAGAKTMLTYQAHLVPAIKMLDHEKVFRVFESRSLMQIIHEVLQDFPNITFSEYIRSELSTDNLNTTIDYAVQFNETSFAFLTRMMNQCGVGYRFDQSKAGELSAFTECMVLTGDLPAFEPVSIPEMIVKTAAPEARVISGFRTSYQPAHKQVTTGDFNILKPSAPWRGQAVVDGDHDVLPREKPASSRFNTEGFPTTAPQLSPSEAGKPYTGDQDAVTGDAKSAIQDEESGVASVAGQSKNRSFLAGQTFHISEDRTELRNVKPLKDFGVPKSKRYVITLIAISAFERDYGNNFGNDFLTFINPARWWTRATGDKDKPGIDITAATASGALQNWFQDEGKGMLDKVHSSPINILYSMGSTALGLTANLLGIIGDSIKELISEHADDYSNIFSAVPWNPPNLAQLPLPAATPPVAGGPHLAVVVGEDGLDTAKGDVYCDALGRVRVRFPWHRTLQSPLEPTEQNDPWKTGRKTAWVRVSDGWASQGFGTQFLPRIGDEVVVSFVDGDPSRPLITGRVYNANTGPSNLPFPVKGSGTLGNVPATYVHDPKGADKVTGPNYSTLRSGIKTRITPAQGGNGKNAFHMLRFDDQQGSEQVLLRSQGRLDVTALKTEYRSIGGDHNLTVGGIDPKTNIAGGNIVQHNFGNYTLHVGDGRAENDVGYRFEAVEKDYELHVNKVQRTRVDGDRIVNISGDAMLHVGAPGGTVTGNRYEKVEKKYDLHVGGNYQVQSDANIITQAGTISLSATEIILEAKTKISLKVGSSFIVIMPAGVHANGPMVTDNTAGNADPALAMNQFAGSLSVGFLAPIADPDAAEPGTS